MEYSIVHCGGHIEIVDICGRFILSADTVAEARHELAEELKSGKNTE